MSSGSETTPPSQIHHLFTSDLLEVHPPAKIHTFQNKRLFQVLSDVLSDLEIRTGDVLEMQGAAPGHTPAPHAIIAVCFVWTGTLLLRQFVRPRMLITNSSKGNLPHLHLGRFYKAVAYLHLDPKS